MPIRINTEEGRITRERMEHGQKGLAIWWFAVLFFVVSILSIWIYVAKTN